MMTNVDKGPSPLVWSKEVAVGGARYSARIVASIGAGQYEWRVEGSVDSEVVRIASGTAKTRREARDQANSALDEVVTLAQRRRRLE